ncbi:ROK family protein [Paenibacillus alkalitolerans]|uniref:ROK family protein n=1 Tax=Paenibacillus alkalitolerans TaxID=2799335 RepID=UPI0018F6FB6F|nr:ROK family protein [Paenibacillus alkalitolerans]
MKYAVGVDIGGTKIRFAAIGSLGEIFHDRTVPSEAGKGAEHVMSAVIEGIEKVITEMRSAMPGADPAGIGVGSAGQIDFRSGSVAFAANTLPGWTGTPIRANVRKYWELPVFVDNDVNVIALAEQAYGAGRHYEHFVCLALGTGIGGAVVADGRLLRGVFGGAGELGHVTVDFRGPRCSCGNFGCVELYASGAGIARLAGEKAKREGKDAEAYPDAAAVVQAWKEGELFAEEVMEVALSALACAIAGWIHTFNPQAVIIGGGVAGAGELFFHVLEEKTMQRTSPAMREACRIVPAAFGAVSGVLGAAAQVWQYGE